MCYDSGSSGDAGWSSPVARWAHNPKVAGSNPAPATKFGLSGGVAQLAEHMVCNHGVRGSNPLTSTKTLSIGDCQLPIVTVAMFAVSTAKASKVERSISV